MDYDTGKLLDRIESKLDSLIEYFREKEQQQLVPVEEPKEEVIRRA